MDSKLRSRIDAAMFALLFADFALLVWFFTDYAWTVMTLLLLICIAIGLVIYAIFGDVDEWEI
jgi:uncharacterized membrane protein YeiH